jgi:hypothetical protein
VRRPEVIPVETQRVSSGEVELVLSLSLPEGYKINPLARSHLKVQASPSASVTGVPQDGVPLSTFPLRLPLKVQADAELQVTADIYYCQSGKEALCYFKQLQWHLPLKVQPGGARQATLEYTLRP